MIPEDRQAQLQVARQLLVNRKFAAAECVCRLMLEDDPANAAAVNVIGLALLHLGLRTRAAEYFAVALRLDKGSAEFSDNLAAARSPAAPPQPSPQPDAAGRKFLLIKSWGCGFWSDVAHVLGALLLAEATGRTPVTHWGGNCLFSADPMQDAFRLYFEQVSGVGIGDLLALPGASHYPPKWNGQNIAADNVSRFHGPYSRSGAIYFLDRPETVAVADFFISVAEVIPWLAESHPMHGKTSEQVHRYLVAKYLQLRPEIAAQVDEWHRAHLGQRPFAAIHMRGSDKKREDAGAANLVGSLLDLVVEADPSWPIFLLTDDERWVDAATARFGSRVVTTDCLRTGTDTGLHHQPSQDRHRLGREIMVDTYVAVRADRFVGYGGSNVSTIISLLKDWPAGTCTIMSNRVLLDRNLFIYLMP